MIELISPKSVKKEMELIQDFDSFGLKHLDINSPLGWNYILDHTWLYRMIENYLNTSLIREPVILDVGCGNSSFHNFVEDKLNIEVLGLDRPAGYCHQNKLKNVDFNVDFLKFKKYAEETVDIIYWLSSIEHNKLDDIKALYEKSMYFLRPGGLLLVTFPISQETSWFDQSQQTNMSIKTALKVFEEKKVCGRYKKTRKEFQNNILYLKDKYEKRYGKFDRNDPEFIVGGLYKIKASL